MAIEKKYVIESNNRYYVDLKIKTDWVATKREATHFNIRSEAIEEMSSWKGTFPTTEKLATVGIGSEALAIAKSYETRSLLSKLMKDFTEKSLKQWEEKLKEYLLQNLQRIGVECHSEEKFLQICKENIKRVVYQDKPNYYEFYYEEFGKTIYLGGYSDKIETTRDGGSITMTIG